MNPFSQEFTGRVRPPRVRLEYELELYEAKARVSPPFVIGVLADLGGDRERGLGERKFHPLDIDGFNDLLRAIAPRLKFTVPDVLGPGPSLEVEVAFSRLDDFSPGSVAARVAPLNALLGGRSTLASLLTFLEGKEEFSSLLERAVAVLERQRPPSGPPEPRSGISPGAAPPSDPEPISGELEGILRARLGGTGAKFFLEAAATFVRLRGGGGPSGGVEPSIRSSIAEIDARLSRQLDLILHHPQFQRLEGAWRGLHFLVSHTETDARLKIKAIDVSKRELVLGIAKFRGTAWDKNPLFRKLEQEFNVPGGEPYGCLVADCEFDHGLPDVETLGGLAQIAEAALAPLIANGSPRLFGLDSWRSLGGPRDLAALVGGEEHAAWSSLRKSKRSRFLALTLPRMLARLPYGPRTHPVEEFEYTEGVDPGRAEGFTWAGSAYAMAANIARASTRYGLPVRIRGIETGGLVEDLPLFTFPTSDGLVDHSCPTEIGISDRRESELAGLGLSPLCHYKDTNYAVFFTAVSLHHPPRFENSEVNARARLVTKLPYLFYGCLFGQVIRCQIRDKIGSFPDAAELEELLNRWIDQYVGPPDPASGQEEGARRPLAEAKLRIHGIEGSPGSYACDLRLVPHFLLEGLPTPIRMTFSVPAPDWS